MAIRFEFKILLNKLTSVFLTVIIKNIIVFKGFWGFGVLGFWGSVPMSGSAERLVAVAAVGLTAFRAAFMVGLAVRPDRAKVAAEDIATSTTEEVEVTSPLPADRSPAMSRVPTATTVAVATMRTTTCGYADRPLRKPARRTPVRQPDRPSPPHRYPAFTEPPSAPSQHCQRPGHNRSTRPSHLPSAASKPNQPPSGASSSSSSGSDLYNERQMKTTQTGRTVPANEARRFL